MKTLATARELKELVDDGWREALENMQEETDDFEVNGYRFIHEDSIDGIMREDLLSDLYCLGACTAWFIADILQASTGLSVGDIEIMQKNDQYEALGRLLAHHIEEVQQGMSSMDGYGQHFNHYDGNEEEIGNYYVFRSN